MKPCFKMAVLSLAALAGATALGDAVKLMKPRSFRPLVTQGVTTGLYNTEQPVFVYSNDAVWDDSTEQFMFYGRYHGMPWYCYMYDAKVNLWRNGTLPFASMYGGHTYDDMTMDNKNGRQYHFTAAKDLFSFDFKTSQWATVSQNGTVPVTGHGMSLEYFPELNGLVHTYLGTISCFDLGTKAWRTLKSGLSMGPYHSLGEYSPVHQVVYCGGGNGSKQMYKVDAQGSVTTLKPAPFEIGIGSGLLTCDPVSGDYLFLSKDSLYGFNIATETWTTLARNPMTGYFNAVVTPVRKYGVVLFVGTYQWPALLYKHTASSVDVESHAEARASATISVYPSPVRGRAEVHIGAAGQLSVQRAAIYDSRGRLVARIGSDGAWDASALPSGIYVIKARLGNRLFSKKMVVEH